MNERIKELLEQATEVYDYWYRGESTCMVDQKMFAELIVRECIVDFYRNYLDTTSDEDITEQVDRYVKQNFGVNE